MKAHWNILQKTAALGAAIAVSAAAAGCRSASGATAEPTKPERLSIAAVVAESRPISRYLRVTGSLLADEQAEVSAETSGRVVATPVERGTRVAAGALLVRVSASETSARLQEADANAAQIQARGPRARRARTQVGGRHRNPRAVRGDRLRAAGQHRGLRDARDPRGDGRACRSDPRRADGAGTVRVARQGRPAGAAGRRRLSGSGVLRTGALRVRLGAGGPPRPHRRGDCAQR